MNNNIGRTIMHNGIVRSVTDNDDVMMTITYLRQILSLIQFMVYFIEHYNSQIQSCIKLNPNKIIYISLCSAVNHYSIIYYTSNDDIIQVQII